MQQDEDHQAGNGSKHFEYFLGVVGAVRFINDMSDMAAFIDDESHTTGNAEQTHRGSGDSTTTYRPVGAADRAIRIGHQWKTEIIFFGEALVRGRILSGNAENVGIPGLDVPIVIAQ